MFFCHEINHIVILKIEVFKFNIIVSENMLFVIYVNSGSLLLVRNILQLTFLKLIYFKMLQKISNKNVISFFATGP